MKPEADAPGQTGPSTAIVTGAGRGYGLVVAQALADAGLTVGVLGRDHRAVETAARSVGGMALVADVLDRDALERACRAFVDRFGGLDVLVNNAGVGGPLGPAWEVDPDLWWQCLEVNLKGTYNATRAALPHMIAAGGGRIINVVSHAGTARWPLGSAYSASKAAMIKLGENLAAELRRHRVSVINYHPGIMELGLTGDLLESSPPEGSADAIVAAWFRQEIAAGHHVAPQRSADQLAQVALGPQDLSGRYITADDDLAALHEQIRSSALARTLGLV